MDSLHTCPISELARLGRTLRRWRDEVLAYFPTGGVNNGGTQAIDGVIEKIRRLAHGVRKFNNYRHDLARVVASQRLPPRRQRRRERSREPDCLGSPEQ